MTMQLAFEHVSPEAHRLSFRERSDRVGAAVRTCRVAMPHVDDVLFAIALAGFFALGSAPLADGVEHAVAASAASPAISAAAPSRVRG